MTTVATMRFEVPAIDADHVRRLVDNANRRAAAHGLTGYHLTVDAPVLRDWTDPFTGRVIGQRPTVAVTLTGNMPRHAGWTILARLDHDPEAGPVASLFPGLSETAADIVRAHRAATDRCDACGISRPRTATYLAHHPNHGAKLLGTTCVEPYTGIPVAGLQALWTLHRIKEGDDDREQGIPDDIRLPVADVLRVAAAVVTMTGRFVPKADAWTGRPTTADDVKAYYFARNAPAEWLADIDAEPAAQAHAADIRAWAIEGRSSENEYRYKIGQLAHAETVAPRHLPTLVSAIVGWRRDREKTAVEKAAAVSRHQGEPGQRLTVTATVTTVVELEARHYGYTTQRRRLVRFMDPTGNVFVWFASAAHVPDEGDEVEVTGTVSKHDAYRDVQQTVMKRCKVRELAAA
ncbi:hypothetical protein ACN20G_11900 [Streptomyces sp. BI20]|uniref:hypothetical protein n=1 Tax=Streptomyces sp. BI20 TaxID=3403460 RepID=UPI003C744E21